MSSIVYTRRTPLTAGSSTIPGTALYPSGGVVSRHVYVSYDSGATWPEITNLVRNGTLQISQRAFSDDFHYAINQCSFECNYDATLFSDLSSHDEVLVEITDYTDTTEVVLFTGRITPNVSRSYNGILENTILSLEAVDSTSKLDVPIGDVCYRNYYVMNPNATTQSIVHQLAYRAGFLNAQISPAVSILTQLNAFSPASEDDSTLDVLDRLLFEYEIGRAHV